MGTSDTRRGAGQAGLTPQIVAGRVCSARHPVRMPAVTAAASSLATARLHVRTVARTHDLRLWVAGNGQASTVLYEIEVEGKPDHSPVYWSNSTGPDPQVARVRPPRLWKRSGTYVAFPAWTKPDAAMRPLTSASAHVPAAVLMSAWTAFPRITSSSWPSPRTPTRPTSRPRPRSASTASPAAPRTRATSPRLSTAPTRMPPPRWRLLRRAMRMPCESVLQGGLKA